MISYFFLIFLLTVLITRLVLFLRPTASPTIATFRTHHYMYGIVGLIAGLLLPSITVYAIGLGLFIDELTYLLMRGKTHEDNYSKISLLGTLCLVIIIFFTQKYFIQFFDAF